MAETEHKIILGDAFVAALLSSVSPTTGRGKATIVAEIDAPVTLTLEKFGDGRLLELLDDGGVRVTTDPREAIAR